MIINKYNKHSLLVNGNIMFYDGIRYELPERIHGRIGRSIVQSGDRVYIDEYRFKNGKFRFSLIGLFHKLF